MTLFGPDFPPRERRTIAPGAIHLPGWLDTRQQRRLVQAFRTWSTGPVPIRAALLPSGHRMSVRTVCLGWHWQPYRYTRTVGFAGLASLDLIALTTPTSLAGMTGATATGGTWRVGPDHSIVTDKPDRPR